MNGLDANGNTTSKTDSTGTTTYSWDYENRLASVALPGSGGTVYFKYDPSGRRIYKSSPSATSIYAYDYGNLVEETNAAGGAVARYSQGLNIDEPLAILRSGTTTYYQADGLGSQTSLSNTSGALASTYTYDSFGNLVASSGSLVNSFRYTAREFDAETNLYYYRARYYDPLPGRFISEDPSRFRGNGPNFYAYVGNDPVRFSDPFGLQNRDEGWFWNTLNWLANKLLNPPQGAKQSMPVNICDAGDLALFWEAGPNPYYKGNSGRDAWVNFQTTFGQRCSAATGGRKTYAVCTAGVTPMGGPFAYCMCCGEEPCKKGK